MKQSLGQGVNNQISQHLGTTISDNDDMDVNVYHAQIRIDNGSNKKVLLKMHLKNTPSMSKESSLTRLQQQHSPRSKQMINTNSKKYFSQNQNGPAHHPNKRGSLGQITTVSAPYGTNHSSSTTVLHSASSKNFNSSQQTTGKQLFKQMGSPLSKQQNEGKGHQSFVKPHIPQRIGNNFRQSKMHEVKYLKKTPNKEVNKHILNQDSHRLLSSMQKVFETSQHHVTKDSYVQDCQQRFSAQVPQQSLSPMRRSMYQSNLSQKQKPTPQSKNQRVFSQSKNSPLGSKSNINNPEYYIQKKAKQLPSKQERDIEDRIRREYEGQIQQLQSQLVEQKSRFSQVFKLIIAQSEDTELMLVDQIKGLEQRLNNLEASIIKSAQLYYDNEISTKNSQSTFNKHDKSYPINFQSRCNSNCQKLLENMSEKRSRHQINKNENAGSEKKKPKHHYVMTESNLLEDFDESYQSQHNFNKSSIFNFQKVSGNYFTNNDYLASKSSIQPIQYDLTSNDFDRIKKLQYESESIDYIEETITPAADVSTKFQNLQESSKFSQGFSKLNNSKNESVEDQNQLPKFIKHLDNIKINTLTSRSENVIESKRETPKAFSNTKIRDVGSPFDAKSNLHNTPLDHCSRQKKQIASTKLADYMDLKVITPNYLLKQGNTAKKSKKKVVPDESSLQNSSSTSSNDEVPTEEMGDDHRGRSSSVYRPASRPLGSECNQKLEAQKSEITHSKQKNLTQTSINRPLSIEAKNDQASSIGNANSVYKTVNLTLSNFISQNKSKIDYSSTYNIIDSGNYNIKQLLEQRGTKCLCKQKIVSKASHQKSLHSRRETYEHLFYEDESQDKADIFNTEDASQICGDYCKKLSAESQRKIIQSLYLKENGNLINRANQGKIGDKKYLISANWWRQWSDFVNFDQSKNHNEIMNSGNLGGIEQYSTAQPTKSGNKLLLTASSGLNASKKYRNVQYEEPSIGWGHQSEQDVLPSESARDRQKDFRNELLNLKQSKSKERLKDDLQVHSNHTNHKNLYGKPSIISNQCLLKDGRSMNLIENIVEHFDYEAVSPDVWRYLYSWYSSDWCIMRYLRRDKVNQYGVILDLYPEKYLELLDPEEEDVENQSQSNSLNHKTVVDLLSAFKNQQ